MNVRQAQVGEHIVDVSFEKGHDLAKTIAQVGPAIQAEDGQVIEGTGKGITFIENGADVLAEQDNLFDDGVRVFLQEFIQNLALFR